MNRELVQADGTYALQEPSEAYTGEYTGENDALAPQSTIAWDKNAGTAFSIVAEQPSLLVCRSSGSRVFRRSLGGNRPEIDGASTSVKRLLRFPTAHVEGVRDDSGSRL